MNDEFEIIDSDGTRHRWARSDGYFWQWGLQTGTDKPDHSIIEIVRENENGDLNSIIVYSNPIAVGDVGPDDCLSMPERQIERCPKCGYGRTT